MDVAKSTIKIILYDDLFDILFFSFAFINLLLIFKKNFNKIRNKSISYQEADSEELDDRADSEWLGGLYLSSVRG